MDRSHLKGLKQMTDVEAADCFDAETAVLAHEVGNLIAESLVADEQVDHVQRALVLHDEKTFPRRTVRISDFF